MGTSAGPSLQGVGRSEDSGLVFSLDATMLAGTSSLPIKNGLEVWLDAADDDTFAYGTGTDVTTWSDKSGNGNDVVQTTAANMPTRIPYTTVTANPCSVVDFNGSTDSLSSTTTVDLATPGVYTQIVVWSCDVGSGDAGLVSINNSLGSGITSHTGTTVWRYYGGGGYNLSSGSLSTGTFYITGKVFPGAGGSVTRVAFQDGTKTTNVGATGIGNASGVLRLGQQTTYLNGKIAEVIIYTRALSDAEMAQIHTYLNQKWNINVSDAGWYDLSGNGINGTMEDNAQYSYATGFSSRAGGCVAWDGTDDYVAMDAITLGTGDLTFTSWFRCDSVDSDALIALATGSHACGLFTKYTAPYTVWFLPSLYDGGSALNYIIRGKTSIKAGLWYYLVGTRRGSELAIYVNGELENTFTSPAPANITSYSPSIGRMRSGQHVLHGQIAKTQIYNRALTAEEVKANFNMFANRLSGSGLYGTHYEYIGWTLKGIVRDNLLLCLDSSDPGCYQGIDTDVFDLATTGTWSASGYPTISADHLSWDFDGSGDYFLLDTHTTTLDPGTGDMTWEIWFQTDLPTTDAYVYSNYQSGDDRIEFRLGTGGALGRMLMWGQPGTTYWFRDTATSAVAATWYHLVVRYDRSAADLASGITFYVNGAVDAGTVGGGTWVQNATIEPLSTTDTIGRRGDGTNEFNGRIGIFRIYNKKLSESEIVQNFQVHRARFGI